MIVRRYTAEFCGPCKKYGPVFDSVATEFDNKGVGFQVIDVEEQPDAAAAFDVTSIPRTDVLTNEGDVVASHVGAMDASLLRAFITDAVQQAAA
jgi:thioredoxin 1